MSNTVVVQQKGHGCLVQLLWFVFVGWWAGQIWIVLSWILMLTILGIPLAVKMLNKLPSVIALRGKPENVILTIDETGATTQHATEQVHILIRILYFLLIGWWFSALWMELAYALCLLIIGMPLGFWMFDKVPTLVSLRKS